MKKYYHLTILRNGFYENVTFSSDISASPTNFLILEIALGNETFILNSQEITEEQHNMLLYTLNKNKQK